MKLEEIKTIASQLKIKEKKELIKFLKSSFPKPKSFSIRRALKHANSLSDVPNVKIIAYRKDVLKQTKEYGGAVDFEMALHLAIDSYLRNGEKTESPFWMVKEVPDDYGLDYETSDAKITQVIHSFLNDGHSSIELMTSESRFPPENGETIDNNWIFLLKANRFSAALHWAIVRRDGQEVYNYGYG